MLNSYLPGLNTLIVQLWHVLTNFNDLVSKCLHHCKCCKGLTAIERLAPFSEFPNTSYSEYIFSSCPSEQVFYDILQTASSIVHAGCVLSDHIRCIAVFSFFSRKLHVFAISGQSHCRLYAW